MGRLGDAFDRGKGCQASTPKSSVVDCGRGSEGSGAKVLENSAENHVAKLKRGRPEKWKPCLLSESDRAAAARLDTKYGVDTVAAEAFKKKYEEFCRLNGLDPREAKSVLLAVGQATCHDAALSSLATNFITFLKGAGIPGGWRVKSLLKRAAQDSAPTQPRVYDPTANGTDVGLKELSDACDEMKDVEDRVAANLSLMTGSRLGHIAKWQGEQLSVDKEGINFLRRLSKTNRSREVLSYKFQWTRKPPTDILKWIEKAIKKGTHLFPKYESGKSDLASHMTQVLRKTKLGCKNPSITSYAFRDFCDARFQEFNEIDEGLFERLMDHTIETSRSSYAKCQVTRAVVGNVVKKAEAAKKAKAKKSPTKTPKKTSRAKN